MTSCLRDLYSLLPDVLMSKVARTPREEHYAQQQAETQARRASERIDAEIYVERAAMLERRHVRPHYKVLVLGHRSSGKSTLVNSECFRFPYATSHPPGVFLFQDFCSILDKSFIRERHSWKAVVQLNLVASVTLIMRVC